MRIPTEREALAHLRRSWANRPVMIQPIETSTGKGVPDLYVWCYRAGSMTSRLGRGLETPEPSGIGWWLEQKRGTRTLSPAQRNWLRRAEARGVPCGVLRVWPGYQFSLEAVDWPDDTRYDALDLYRVLTHSLRG